MNYFICSLGKIHKDYDNSLLGIASSKVEKIIATEELIENKKQISIPSMLKLKDLDLTHSLILKQKDAVLLCPKIEVEIDIEEESIKSLPLSITPSYNFFRGLCFKNNELILILDTDKLLEEVI